MNTTLFKSRWALTALVIAAAFVGWMALLGAKPGARETPAEVTLLLWSGWITFSLMAGVCLYSLRKYVHKLGISPEFRMKVPLDKLEEADVLINDLRRRILLDRYKSAREVQREADSILAQCGVNRINRAVVSAGEPFLVVILPTEPLGRMRKWLHFHAYLGLASGVVLWVHGGASFASPMGALMNALTLLVILTGIGGTILFAVGPRWMTRAERDMNFEDAFVLEQSLKRKIQQAYGALKPEQVKVFKKAEKTGQTVEVQRTALQQAVGIEPAARREMEDVMVLVAQRRRILEDLKGAARVRFLINIWRAVHIPASLVLLGVAVVHVVSVIWY